MTLEKMLSATGGKLIPASEDKPCFIRGASVDSRRVEKDSLFVCVVGNNVDSHNFACQAVQNGASVILASRNPFAGEPPVPVVIVPDTVEALCLAAKAARDQTRAKVVGVTGTAGKTTVKELIAQILSAESSVAKNYLNYNTQIGMSLSMLQAEGNEDFWVMEAGISKPRDMDELGKILNPDVALILNVGPAHIDGLGEKGAAYHKASLLKRLKSDGSSFISGDYPELEREALKIVSNPFLFSTKNEKVPYYIKYLGSTDTGKGAYRLCLNGERLEAISPFLGNFGAESVIASAAVAHFLGASKEAIIQAFSNAKLPSRRFSCFQVGDWTCIDDTYNANPLSMRKTALAAFEASKKNPPLVYVLGDMLELGDKSEKEHEDLGRVLAGTGAKVIFWKGDQTEAVKLGLKRGHFSGDIQKLSTGEELKEALRSHNINRGTVVFKGSRSHKMETFVEAFIDWVGVR